MKTIIKPVYYCEFCNKRGLSKPMMAKHEKHCTRNPNRQCRMCDEDWNLPELVEKFKQQTETREVSIGDDDFGYWTEIEAVKWPDVNEICDSVNGCPVCTMAILKQTGLTWYYFKDKVPFDYQQAKNEWWQEHNNYNQEF